MENERYDLVIIGAGPGGYTAAIYAAHHGLKVAVVEKNAPGGVCLNLGCIPTKAIASKAYPLRNSDSAIASSSPEENFAKAFSHSAKVVKQLSQGVKFLLQKNGIDLINGHAVFDSPRTIRVAGADGGLLRTIDDPANIVIATGSAPAGIPTAQRDGINILDSNDVIGLDAHPGDLLIIGGGYIGCEFADIFSALGCNVTIVEALDRLLPGADNDLSAALERAFKRKGIRVHTETKVDKITHDTRITAGLSSGGEVTADKALIAVGRTPNTAGIGLENAGVTVEDGIIEVNDFMQTGAPGIYAIGDVTGKIALAHVASAQARVAVDNILGANNERPGRAMDYAAIPSVVYTDPEIASVGITEDAARESGQDVITSRFPFAAAGKAVVAGRPEGFIKLIADSQSGRILGGHIFGIQASELSAALTIAVQWRLTAEQLEHTVFAHPTVSESIHEAAEGVFGKPIHIIKS